MKFFIKIILTLTSISSLYSSELINKLEQYEPESSFLTKISLYGIGEKFENNNYSGLGFNYNSDYSKVVIEKNDTYKKISMIKRIDLNDKLYTKIGLAHLSKKESLNENIENLNQTTLATALGYGDNDSYNFEFGYFENILMNMDNISTKIWYSEISLKHDIKKIGSIDYTFSHQSKEGFDKVISDYVATSSFYPIDDIKLALKYNSIEQNTDLYKISARINYKFDDLSNFLSGKIVPFLSIENNSSENISLVATYKKDIANRNLKIRNKFNEEASTNDIIAKKINIEKLQEELM